MLLPGHWNTITTGFPQPVVDGWDELTVIKRAELVKKGYLQKGTLFTTGGIPGRRLDFERDELLA